MMKNAIIVAALVAACGSEKKPNDPPPPSTASNQEDPITRARKDADAAKAELVELETKQFAGVTAAQLIELQRKRHAAYTPSAAEGCATFELLVLAERKGLDAKVRDELVRHVHRAVWSSRGEKANRHGLGGRATVIEQAREDAATFTCDATDATLAKLEESSREIRRRVAAVMSADVPSTDPDQLADFYFFHLLKKRLEEFFKTAPELERTIRLETAARRPHTLRCTWREITRGAVQEPYLSTDELTPDLDKTAAWVAAQVAAKRVAPKTPPPASKDVKYAKAPEHALCVNTLNLIDREEKPVLALAGTQLPGNPAMFTVSAFATPSGDAILFDLEAASGKVHAIAPFDPAGFATFALRMTAVTKAPAGIEVTCTPAPPAEYRDDEAYYCAP